MRSYTMDPAVCMESSYNMVGNVMDVLVDKSLLFFLYPWVYSSQELKAKKVKIKAWVTIGPERRRSRKCRAEELELKCYNNTDRRWNKNDDARFSPYCYYFLKLFYTLGCKDPEG